MADEAHLSILKQGVGTWNSWRKNNLGVEPDLGATDLSRASLIQAMLSGANLRGSDLIGTDLERAMLLRANLAETHLNKANLDCAILRGANLRKASLRSASLNHSILAEADLEGVNLEGAYLVNANLNGANLVGVHLGATSLNNVDLSVVTNLETCIHFGPSSVDFRTLQRSKGVPISFWRGCGLSDQIIDYLPSLTADAIQFYSCFISYSSKDQEFAERLHADLQNNGVRCWFAPHDLPIGAFTEEAIDRQIRFRDKVVLILSEASVRSAWVNREVRTALNEEASGRRVLFPLRTDDAVMNTTAQWAYEIKETRNIGDFKQ